MGKIITKWFYKFLDIFITPFIKKEEPNVLPPGWEEVIVKGKNPLTIETKIEEHPWKK